MDAEVDLRNGSCEGWPIKFLGMPGGKEVLRTVVPGIIMNSAPGKNNQSKSSDWKRKIAKKAHRQKKLADLRPSYEYAVSLNMRFHRGNHGYKKLDPENFVKPIVDGVAAGMFSQNADFDNMTSFNYDDSNFKHILIETLSPPSEKDGEGVAIVVFVNRS